MLARGAEGDEPDAKKFRCVDVVAKMVLEFKASLKKFIEGHRKEMSVR